MFKVKNKIYIFIFLAGVFLLPSWTLAAEIRLETKIKEITVGETIEVKVFLNTKKENINAVEGEIIFAPPFFLKEIRDGNSLISFWIKRPQLEADSKITFAGIIPGGYSGTWQLFSFVGKLQTVGTADFFINQGKAFLNDGLGTAASLSVTNLTLAVVQSEEKTTTPEQKIFLPAAPDSVPPESFLPLLGNEPGLFNGQWFLVFATQDRGLGIDHYEVREGDDSFMAAESPYLLKDQKLRSQIWVKAVDRAGNERVEKMTAKNGAVWYENLRIWGIILVLITLMLVKKLCLKRKR